MGARPEVGIGKPPLPAAGKEHALRLGQRRDKRLAVRDLAIAGVEDGEIAGAVLAEDAEAGPGRRIGLGVARGRNHDNRGVGAARQADEARDDGGVLHRAADDDEGSVGRADLLGVGRDGHEDKQRKRGDADHGGVVAETGGRAPAILRSDAQR